MNAVFLLLLLLARATAGSSVRGLCSLNKAVAFSCSDNLQTVVSKGVACVNTGVDVFCSGYAQVSSINKNPVFAKYSASSPENAPLWCRTDYETTGDDGTGQGVVLDTVEGSLYGLFTATGDQGTADFGRWASNGWLRSYSDASPAGGGGAKVSIVAKIDPETGDPLLATFVTALLSSGKVNSVSSVIAAGWISQNGGGAAPLALGLSAAFHARNKDKSAKDCNCACNCCPDPLYYNPDRLWNWELVLDANLSRALYSCAPACDPNQCRDSALVPVVSCGSAELGNVGWNWEQRILGNKTAPDTSPESSIVSSAKARAAELFALVLVGGLLCL